MNLKSFLALIVLTGVGVALLVYGLKLPESVAPRKSETPQQAESAKVLENDFLESNLQRVVIQREGKPWLELTRAADGTWALPGNWPLLAIPQRELFAQLSTLRTRFVPIPRPQESAEQVRYGLTQPPLFEITATTKAGTTHRLAVGEGQPVAGDNTFYRPTYVRLGDKPEILRLQSELIATLRRPRDAYMKRQLYESEPVENASSFGEGEKTFRLQARSVSVQDLTKPGEAYKIELKDDQWLLESPAIDRLDPDRKNVVLEAIPDIWAEVFYSDVDLKKAGLQLSPERLAAVALAVNPGVDQHWLTALTAQAILQTVRDENGPEKILRVVDRGGNEKVLLIGRKSTSRFKTVMRPPPMGIPGVPPMEDRVEEEYRYARLMGNDQIFEVRAAKFKDIFVAPQTLRDPRLARFDGKDAYKIVVKHGTEQTLLEKDKKDNVERWLIKPATPESKIDPVEADPQRVLELVDKLAALQVQEADILDRDDAASQGFDKPLGTVQVWVEEEVKDSKEEPKPKRKKEYTFTLGKQDAAAKKVFVKVAGWPRINHVEDSVVPLVQRQTVAYRSRRVLDFEVAQANQIDVDRGGKKLALTQSAGTWELTVPVKARIDAAKALQLVEGLAKLEVVEFVTEAPRAEDMGPLYGLAMPAATVTIDYKTDKGAQKKTLLIGKQRAGKPDFYASLSGSERVFAVSAAVNDLAAREALSYLPQQLWQMTPDKMASITVKKEKADPFTLEQVDKGWKIATPFQANAQPALAFPVAESLANPLVEKYETFEAKDLDEYGLKTPELRVEVKSKDANTKPQVLLIGKKTKDGLGRYAKAGDEPSPIAIIPDGMVGALDRGPLDYLDTQLASVPPGAIKKIQSKQGDTAFVIEQPKRNEWKVTQAPGVPAAFDADANTTTELLTLLLRFRAEKYADYGTKADFKKYGLDPPAATLTVDVETPAVMDKPAEKKQYVVQLGNAVDGKPTQRYARLVDNDKPGVVVLSEYQSEVLQRTYLSYVDHTLFKLALPDIEGLTRTQGDPPLQLDLKADGWELVKPAPFKADEETLRTLTEGLVELRATKIAAYPLKNPADFGLDKPLAEWKIRLKDGKERILKIGKEADKTNGDHYAQVDQSQVVAVLPAAVVKRLTAKPIAFRDREIKRFDDASKFVIERGQRKITVERVEGSWKLTAPIKAAAEQNEADEFVNQFAKLKAHELIEDDAKDLAKYGLDKPAAKWQVFDGDKKVLELLVGKADSTGQRCYAKLAESGVVFLLSVQQTSRVLGELRLRAVWPEPIDALQIEQLTYTRGKDSWILQKIDNLWQVRGQPEAKVEQRTVNDTLAALAGLKLQRYAIDKTEDLKLYLLDPPELSIEVLLRDGTKHTLQLGGTEGESKQAYARLVAKDRSDVFILSKLDTARIARDVAAFGKPVPVQPGGPGGIGLER